MYYIAFFCHYLFVLLTPLLWVLPGMGFWLSWSDGAKHRIGADRPRKGVIPTSSLGRFSRPTSKAREKRPGVKVAVIPRPDSPFLLVSFYLYFSLIRTQPALRENAMAVLSALGRKKRNPFLTSRGDYVFACLSMPLFFLTTSSWGLSVRKWMGCLLLLPFSRGDSLGTRVSSPTPATHR